MAEGIFLQPRTLDDGVLKAGKTALFGTAGVSVTAKGGRLYRARFVNKAATAYFAQIHNKATAPVATNVPVWEGVLPANGECVFEFGDAGLFCSLGIGLAISTTADVLTMAAATDAIAFTQHTVTT